MCIRAASAIDKQGHVWWPELRGGMLGELDPATGQQIRHACRSRWALCMKRSSIRMATSAST